MRLATLLVLLLAAPTLAQTPGDCDLGSAARDLDVSDVLARMFITGSLGYGEGTTNGDGYLVPAHTGNSPLFAAGIWVGGMVDGDLRVAGSTYDRYEFWPGPLEQGATLPSPYNCSPYDRIWVVSTETIAHYEQTGYAAPDLAEWPVELGAEVIDGDGIEGNYDLEGGDRPHVYGSQTAFWVMNDVGNVHRKSLTDPIGLEVQVTAFSIASEDPAFDQATFYRYRLVNRNDQPLEDAYFAYFTDTDLGDAADDYVGVDTTRGLAFTYNGMEEDAVYGTPPAFGVDFLNDGLGAFMYFIGGVSPPLLDPANGEQMYEVMQGRWTDGTPMTEGGNGYQTDGDTTTFAFPGDPVTGEGWSEINEGNAGGDRRFVPTSPSFTLAPGEAKDVWLALVFGQGTDHLDSITELRAASDAVQDAFNSGALFETAVYDPPITLAAPELLSPPDGTHLTEEEPLTWTDVAGSDYYRVHIATTPDFSDRRTYFTEDPSLTGYFSILGPNEVHTVHWRVRAEEEAGVSPYSEPRSFVHYRYEFDFFGMGDGVVETTNPDVNNPCADDPTDPGCAEGYPGNTVWLHPNATDDYILTNPANSLSSLLASTSVVDGESFEVRFTEDCTEPGACLGVFASALPQGSDLIASVPFELWNTGPVTDGEDDPSDDERMIPLLRAYSDTEPASDWLDTFPATQDVLVAGDTLSLGVTHRVLGLMPDRAGGYELFQQAAQDFGGPGATYDPETDGDTQIDINPSTGEPCLRQHYYADFCWRGGNNYVVAPIGGLNGFVLADLAGDGATPEAGTTIRFHANEVLVVDAEDDGPASPAAFGIQVAYPNPFRAEATVAYRLDQPGDVRLAVYDVLGRRVAVLAEGPQTAGEHRAAFEAGGLASGLYLVVLEAGGERHTRKLLLVR